MIAWIAGSQAVSAQEVLTTLPSISTTADTGEKPQSKAWFHGHTWWTILATNAPSPGGTWLCRLEPDGTWAFALQLSSNTGSKADTKVVGDVTHVLLKNSLPELVSLQYVPASNTYQLWSGRPTATPVYVGETGTIDVDSTDRMWLATESDPTGVEVYYSDYPYASFTGPILLATDIAPDDITAVTALPNHTIGVLWSNRYTRRFGFRIHEDGTDPTVWLDDEVPASQSANDNGTGMADDHVHLAVAPDGTLYAAVKTSHEPGTSFPLMGLLVRHPNPGGPGGTWDGVYFVDNQGTRPIVVFNEDRGTIRVFYTTPNGEIVFRESPASPIAFGPAQTVMSGGFNNVTSAKDRWSGRLLVLASNLAGATGVVMTTDPGLVGYWKTDEGGGIQLRDMSGWGNHADIVGSPTWVPGVKGLALDLDGFDNAVVSDQDALNVATGLTLSAWIKPAAQTDQDLISRALIGSVDGYTLGMSSSSSPTSPRTVFLRLNQATSGNLYQLNSLSQYPSGGYTWVHVAATYDGTTMRIFVDGVEESSMLGPGSIAANAVDVGIGAQNDGTRRFKGTLDDLRIYNRALTAADIASLAGSGPPQADLAITKDDFVSAVTLGQHITYNIHATNLGPSDVNGATVSDIIPSPLTSVTWTCSAAAGAACSPGGSGSINDLVNLPVGGSVFYTVNAIVSMDAVGSFVRNTATISASHFSDPVPDNNSSTDTDTLPFLIDAHFDSSTDDFNYADDIFRATHQPTYASGAQLASGGFNGGALQVILGGVNGRSIRNMSGGWRRSLSLTSPAPATLSFRYQLTAAKIDIDAFGQLLVSLDGVLYGLPPHDYVAQIAGTGSTTTTGWQLVQADLGTLPAGAHVLALGGYLNKKNESDKFVELLIDDVRLISGAGPGPGAGPVPPSIATPPTSVTVTEPAPATFSVVASGTAPLSYQWRRNGVAIAGATSASYGLTPTAVADSGASFDVIVANAAGSVTSASAILTVNPAPVLPSITTPPTNVTVTAPTPAMFSVVASGTAPLSYQWRRNGAAIAGATGASYVLTPTAGTDSGALFSVVVTNVAGSVTSTAATLTVNVPPSIMTPPANVTVTAPAPATFSVLATGDTPLSYQWRRNGVAIAGATSASYVLDPTAVTDSGAAFSVVVSNAAGSVTSTPATLTVLGGGGGSTSAFSYYGSFSRYPTTDNGSSGSSATVAITPPAGMSAGQLAVIFAFYRDTSNHGQAVNVSASGGQTWNAETAFLDSTSHLYVRVFWSLFNGTWSANPSFAVSTASTSVNAYTLSGEVFDAPAGAKVDVSFNPAQLGITASLSHAGVTTTAADALVFGGFVQDGNQTFSSWTSGWTNPTGVTQWRNSRGDKSVFGLAYKVMTSAGATGTLSASSSALKQSAAFMIAFRAP